mmetsp:Transcript_97282/g.272246  ORF Transcript_97282/g.272246 Transcript_97282/m.272246 type:complete len:320 (-) Transcript_97282:217-1176(-)
MLEKLASASPSAAAQQRIEIAAPTSPRRSREVTAGGDARGREGRVQAERLEAVAKEELGAEAYHFGPVEAPVSVLVGLWEQALDAACHPQGSGCAAKPGHGRGDLRLVNLAVAVPVQVRQDDVCRLLHPLIANKVRRELQLLRVQNTVAGDVRPGEDGVHVLDKGGVADDARSVHAPLAEDPRDRPVELAPVHAPVAVRVELQVGLRSLFGLEAELLESLVGGALASERRLDLLACEKLGVLRLCVAQNAVTVDVARVVQREDEGVELSSEGLVCLAPLVQRVAGEKHVLLPVDDAVAVRVHPLEHAMRASPCKPKHHR